ncbi:UNVERIFIED_CONTAM: hypothetical protein K2H54_025666 [Gekko kuhli]
MSPSWGDVSLQPASAFKDAVSSERPLRHYQKLLGQAGGDGPASHPDWARLLLPRRLTASLPGRLLLSSRAAGAPGLSWPGSQGQRHHLNFLDTLCGVCGAHGWGARATLPFQEVVALKDKEIMMDCSFNIEPKFLPAMRAVGELRSEGSQAGPHLSARGAKIKQSPF